MGIAANVGGKLSGTPGLSVTRAPPQAKLLPPAAAGIAVVPKLAATTSDHTGPGLVVNLPAPGGSPGRPGGVAGMVPASVRLSPKNTVVWNWALAGPAKAQATATSRGLIRMLVRSSLGFLRVAFPAGPATIPMSLATRRRF